MSAFIVDNDHIDYLISAAITLTHPYGVTVWQAERTNLRSTAITRENASDIGRELLTENTKSVNSRYNEQTPAPAYDFKTVRPTDLTAVQALKAAHCFEYQACESPTWEGSFSQRFCQALARALDKKFPGYEEAEWEWTRAEAAAS